MSTATELLRRALESLEEWKEERNATCDDVLIEEIRAFLAAEPETEEPVAWPVDREWLRTVLRFAEKNPDYFYDVEPGFISLNSGDTDTIITALNKPAEPARKPMTEEEIDEELETNAYYCAKSFADGVRWAEKHHGIGDKE